MTSPDRGIGRLLRVGILREPVPGRYFLVQTSA